MLAVGWRRDEVLSYVSEVTRQSGEVTFLWLDDLELSLESALERVRRAMGNHAPETLLLRWIVQPSIVEQSPHLLKLSELLQSCPPTEVLGHPNSNITNFSKFVHSVNAARIANMYGIKQPKSLLSNDAGQIQRGLGGRSIVKGASSQKSICAILSDHHLSKLHAGTCNGYIQELIEGADVRVHGTPSNAIAEMIVARSIDYRFARKKAFAAIELPSHIREFSRAMAEEFDLAFFGMDFKLNTSGEWFFLEVNASPAFQGYDRRCGGNIMQMILKWDAESAVRRRNANRLKVRQGDSADA